MESWVLQVEGMSCTGCERRIGSVLRRIDDVTGVTADHTSGRVEVRANSAASRDVTVQRIEAAGFRVTEQTPR
ncbi:heavy-metal-associated domain-containing protein [Amycolatopsis palatopharyngis]|uniref:heavy-metal-associated domain-containing protein n=1 Tax=Amycolatopsis palatopharyngis TaxID=187982 RepID=UPI000E23ABBD|nr:heavy metal-associated domain-containing protein [Amycolatopsis palatopharyngis]